MNGALIGGILLMGYSIFTGHQIQTEGLDWTPLNNAKVWGGGLVGAGTILVQLKPFFSMVLGKLNAIAQAKANFDKTQIKSVITQKVEEKVQEVERPMNNPKDVSELDKFDIGELENEDLVCLNYLMKRVKMCSSEEGLNKVRELNNLFFDIHAGEAGKVNNEKVA